MFFAPCYDKLLDCRLVCVSCLQGHDTHLTVDCHYTYSGCSEQTEHFYLQGLPTVALNRYNIVWCLAVYNRKFGPEVCMRPVLFCVFVKTIDRSVNIPLSNFIDCYLHWIPNGRLGLLPPQILNVRGSRPTHGTDFWLIWSHKNIKIINIILK